MRSSLKTAADWLRSLRTAVLTIAGFTGLSAAAWIGLGPPAGLAAIGLSCLAVEALGGDR